MPPTTPPAETPKSRPRPTDGLLLGIPAAARYLGVSAFTLRGLVRRGAVPLVELPGVAGWYVARRDLEALVVERSKGTLAGLSLPISAHVTLRPSDRAHFPKILCPGGLSEEDV